MAIVFTHLRAFQAVATHRGFSAAARALRVSQPTLTTQVRELEERYGVELFLRQGRQIELTEAGRSLLSISARLFKLHEEAEELLLNFGELKTGALKIAAVSPFHATDMIARFIERYPSFKVNMLLGNSDRTLKRILELEADIAILAHTIDDPRIKTMTFSTQEIVAFVNDDHAWWQRDEIELAELAGEPLILREEGSTTRYALERAAEAANVALTPFMEIGSREGVWKAVERGLGIGVVADFEFVPHPHMKTLRISGGMIRTEYRLAFLEDRKTVRSIKAFVETVL